MINIYTDGSSRGNPGPGGYGVILTYKNHRKELSDGFKRTTNNRMELLAVIIGLEAIKEPNIPITIYSDSKYVVEAVEKRWVYNWLRNNFKDKKNEDLWRRFILVYEKYRVKFVWIKGHAGHPENERCDVLAVTAALKSNLPEDLGYEG